MVLSSPSLREGGEEGEEGVAVAKGEEGVAAAMEEDNDEPVKVIPVLESPPRGRPTETLAPWTGAREDHWRSPETRSEVWSPTLPPSGAVRTATPPPPPPTIAMTPTPPPLQQEENTTPPPLLSPTGGKSSIDVHTS
jgi:hypothetical protein